MSYDVPGKVSELDEKPIDHIEYCRGGTSNVLKHNRRMCNIGACCVL